MIGENPFIALQEETVIAAGSPRRHRAFPTGVRLPNGDLLVGFRDGSDHHMTHDGAFYITRSTDNGRHWTPPKVLCAYPGWDVCASMGQFPDGVMSEDEPFLWVRLQLYRWQYDAPPDDDLYTYRTLWTVSYDNGHNWEDPFPLEDGPLSTITTDRGQFTVSALSPHSYGSTLMRLPDGTIMGMFVGNKELMKYRKETENRNKDGQPATITEMPMAGFSKDNMRTWDEFVVIADPDEYNMGFSESDITQLDSGRIVAIYGNNQGSRSFFRTYSDDLGRSWAKMKQIELIGASPSMIQLADGTLLAAHRNCSEPIGIGVGVSTDGGESWQLLGNLLDQGGWDMGYPDLIRMADGHILCIFYTAAEKVRIDPDEEQRLLDAPSHRVLGFPRRSLYEEMDGQIRGMFLEDLTEGHLSEPQAVGETL